ncbi:MAG TPA: GlxA family transcriptional regulator [Dongiaceae bacterium]|nr:GlxA family transcriptional regulator [Dongiaceae bacterium]
MTANRPTAGTNSAGNHQSPCELSFEAGRIATIDLLVVNEFSMMSLAATIEPLRAANRASSQQLYRWRLLSWDERAPASSSGVKFAMDGRFDPSEPRDILFVVAAFNARTISRSQAAALRKAARNCIAVAGVEAGAWILGRAGLLDDHTATTHWEDLEEFACEFPKVNVVNERFIMDRARWTAGGAAPALDMMLSLIRHQHGLSLALDVASIFIYDQREAGSAPQSVVSLGQLSLTDPMLVEAINIMQGHLEEALPIPRIARQVKVPLRTMQAHFQERLGQGPHEYYLHLRLAAAKRMIEQTDLQVAEIAAAYGFGSASAFARAFRRRFQYSPMEARARQRPSA